MDEVGSERAAIMGLSETGAVALLFGATYPERTQAVIAYGWRANSARPSTRNSTSVTSVTAMRVAYRSGSHSRGATR